MIAQVEFPVQRVLKRWDAKGERVGFYDFIQRVSDESRVSREQSAVAIEDRRGDHRKASEH